MEETDIQTIALRPGVVDTDMQVSFYLQLFLKIKINNLYIKKREN